MNLRHLLLAAAALPLAAAALLLAFARHR